MIKHYKWFPFCCHRIIKFCLGCKFISYDITEGEFDFILVVEGDSEQAIAAKGGAMLSGDFDIMISIKAVSVDSIRKNLKKMQSAYTPPSAN